MAIHYKVIFLNFVWVILVHVKAKNTRKSPKNIIRRTFITAKTGNKNFPRDGCKTIRVQNCLLDS